jgi:3-oxoadipate CoA-transferase alpha subunit
MSINKLFDSFDKAVADVFDGAVILIGGFGPSDGTPSYLIRALVRQGAKNLTLVANTPGQGRQTPGASGAAPRALRKSPPNYDNGGLLIQHGQVSKIISAFPGAGLASFGQRIAEGKLTIEMVPQGTLAERIRASKAGIPAFYTPTGAETNTIVDKGKESRIINGTKYLLEYALKADFALIRAHLADRWGNLVYQGTSRNFNGAMAGAAEVTIAEVDEMVELGALKPETIATPSIYVNRLVSRKDSKEEKGVV